MDIEVHITARQRTELLGSDEEFVFQPPFAEDEEEIARMIEEECGTPRRRKRSRG